MLVLALAIRLFGGVEVTGATECPKASEVGERIRALLPTPFARSDRATLEEHEGEIRIELRAANGALVGQRTVAAQGSCADRAESIAVTLAAWEGDLDGGGVPRGPLPVHIEVPAVAPAPTRVDWEVGAGFLGSVAGGAFAPGAIVDFALRIRPGHLAVRVGAEISDTRDISIGMGRASWNRWALTLGPAYSLGGESTRIDLHTDAALGWLFVDGHGYPMNQSDDGIDPAIRGGIRGAMTRATLQPWIDISVVGWLRHQTVSVAEPGNVILSADIPRVDVWLTCGVSFAPRP